MPRYRNKFKAVKVEEDGFKFDSKAEHLRYQQLRPEVAVDHIRNLRHHVRFDLHVNGIKLGYYEADFTYDRRNDCGEWCMVVEDVKSPFTAKLPMYRWKKKHLKAEYNIDIQEVYPRCPSRKTAAKRAKRASRRAARQSLVSWTTRKGFD